MTPGPRQRFPALGRLVLKVSTQAAAVSVVVGRDVIFVVVGVTDVNVGIFELVGGLELPAVLGRLRFRADVHQLEGQQR